MSGRSVQTDMYSRTVLALFNVGESTIERYPRIFTALPAVLVTQLAARRPVGAAIQNARYLAEDLQDVGREQDNEEMVAAGQLLDQFLDTLDD